MEKLKASMTILQTGVNDDNDYDKSRNKRKLGSIQTENECEDGFFQQKKDAAGPD
jgi:hypothetical protein